MRQAVPVTPGPSDQGFPKAFIVEARLTVDAAGQIAGMNPAAEELLGIHAGEACGTRVEELVRLPRLSDAKPPAGQSWLEALGRYASASHGVPLHLHGVDNQVHQVVVRCQPVDDPQQLPGGWELRLQDVTWLWQLERHLRPAQKRESLGRLTSGVAHALNNLLFAIMGRSGLLAAAVTPDQHGHAAAISRVAEEAATLMGRLLASEHPQEQWSPFSVHQLIQDACALLRHGLEKRITLEDQLRAEQEVMTGDPEALRQVLVNLALNANAAMPAGGRLLFATRDRVLDPGTAWEHGIPPGPVLEVQVEDNGVGMPPAVLRRACEPLFTTRPPGFGAGLGLATAYAIVSGMGGHLSLESEPGVGTRATILLPLSPPDLPAANHLE